MVVAYVRHGILELNGSGTSAGGGIGLSDDITSINALGRQFGAGGNIDREAARDFERSHCLGVTAIGVYELSRLKGLFRRSFQKIFHDSLIKRYSGLILEANGSVLWTPLRAFEDGLTDQVLLPLT